MTERRSTARSFCTLIFFERLTIISLALLNSGYVPAQPQAKPTPQPTAHRALPKLPSGARGFDSSQKTTARLIAVGGGYGGADNPTTPKLKAKTAEGYYRLGVELYNADHDQDIAAFEKAISLNPSMAKAYWKLGNAYAESDAEGFAECDHGECVRRAIAAFLQVTRLQPWRGGAYNNLAILYFNNRQYEKSISAFQKGLSLKRKGSANEVSLVEFEKLNDREIYAFIGDAYEKLDLNAKALENYLRAQKLPSSQYYWLDLDERLGVIYEKLNQAENAIASYERVDVENGSNPQVRHQIRERLGVLYESKGDHQRAISYLAAAILDFEIDLQNYPNNSLPANATEAEKETQYEAEKLRKDFANCIYNLGVVYLITTQFEKAADAFRRAIENNPSHAAAHFNLGFLLATNGNKAAASEQLLILKTLDAELSKELQLLIQGN